MSIVPVLIGRTIQSSQINRKIQFESDLGGRRRVIVSKSATRTRAFLLMFSFITTWSRFWHTKQSLLSDALDTNSIEGMHIPVKYVSALVERSVSILTCRRGTVMRKTYKMRHAPRQRQMFKKLLTKKNWDWKKKKKRRATKWHFPCRGYTVVDMPPCVCNRAITENRDNTCNIRMKEKESRSVRSGSQGMPRVWWLRAGFPPLRGHRERWARVHLILKWFGPRALGLLPVCCIAVLGYVVKVAGLFVSLPRTRYLSFSFPPFNIMHVFLSLSLHLFLSFFFFQMLCLILLYTPPLSSSRPCRLFTSSHDSFTVYIAMCTDDDVTATAGTGLVFEYAAPITQGETSLGSLTWVFKVDDGTSLLRIPVENILAATKFTSWNTSISCSASLIPDIKPGTNMEDNRRDLDMSILLDDYKTYDLKLIRTLI